MSKTISSIKVETRDVKWLVDEMRNERLFVDDSFQRRFVWLEKHQISLIETILKGMPIPEIYLWQQETDPDTGETKHSIIDGQQRIKSVYRYVNNEFPLNENYLEDKDETYVGKRFQELNAEEKSKIWSYNFSIRFVGQDISEDDIIKMFLRLNNTSLSLNPQELRHAEFQGEFIKAAGSIAKFPFWERNSIFNLDDIRRMKDVQFISSILIFIRRGIEEETTQKNINTIYDLYNEEYPQAEEDISLVQKMLAEVQKVINANEIAAQFLKKKTHLYTLLVTIYFFLSTAGGLTSTQVSDYIKFIEAYEDESDQKAVEYFSEDFASKLRTYRKLSLTGTQAKANRLERFKILKETLM